MIHSLAGLALLPDILIDLVSVPKSHTFVSYSYCNAYLFCLLRSFHQAILKVSLDIYTYAFSWKIHCTIWRVITCPEAFCVGYLHLVIFAKTGSIVSPLCLEMILIFLLFFLVEQIPLGIMLTSKPGCWGASEILTTGLVKGSAELVWICVTTLAVECLALLIHFIPLKNVWILALVGDQFFILFSIFAPLFRIVSRWHIRESL